MSQSSDLDPLKEIPGYKAILKSVLKSQIQLLIEQLADHTGEESIILTASINDGTLSHLGSNTGKGFLEGRDEMKSQFLGYCLKTHHRKKQAAEPKTPSYQRTNQRHMPYRPPPKHDRLQPISLQRTRPVEDTGVGLTDSRIPDLVSDNSGNEYVKQEGSDINTSTAATFPDSLQLSHTQTLGELENSGQGNGVSQGQIQGQTSESGEQDSEDANNDSSANIKIEPITENEMELEITGVEPGNVSLGQDDWGQGQPGYTTAGADGDASLSQGADASNYNRSNKLEEYDIYIDLAQAIANQNSEGGQRSDGDQRSEDGQSQSSDGGQRSEVGQSQRSDGGQRSEGGHYPVYISESKHVRRLQKTCVLCKLRCNKKEKRRWTIYMCEQCRHPLCLPECFRNFHKQGVHMDVGLKKLKKLKGIDY